LIEHCIPCSQNELRRREIFASRLVVAIEQRREVREKLSPVSQNSGADFVES
jgi:hypothetical protein